MINLQPYENPQYFIYLLVALLPLVIGLYFGKRYKWYEAAVSLLFLFFIFDADKWKQGVTLIAYIIYQFAVTFAYQHYRQKTGKANKTWIFCTFVVLAILPLAAVKIWPVVPHKAGIDIGFLGISYLTFKTVQVVMELRDRKSVV